MQHEQHPLSREVAQMLTPDDDPLDEGQLKSFDALREELADGGDPRFSYVQLENVPPHLWRQALTPLHPQQRFGLAHRIPDKRLKAVVTTRGAR
ncbi:MAG TPA: hypothetical protein VHZ75_01055 [Solirubrobacteraceae bacterium]|nr:hypothetical protein [Solirubrobacteraceae bacterium]